MKRISSSFLVITFLCVQGVASAQAPTYAYSTPRTSPYLNLLRRGSSPAVNYYGLVRPEVEYRTAIGQLQQQTQANQQAIAGVGAQGGVLTTGNVAGFMNYGSYFQNAGSGAGGLPGGTGVGGFQSVPGGVPGAMGAGSAARLSGGGASRPSGRR
jgi:hypothetical protein